MSKKILYGIISIIIIVGIIMGVTKGFNLGLAYGANEKIEIYIGNSKETFDNCYAHKNEIETIVGAGLDWRRLDGKKASRIILERSADVSDPKARPEQFDWYIDNLSRMKKAFVPYIK